MGKFSPYERKALTDDAAAQMRTQPPICDFCGDSDPQWLYASSRMSTGEMIRCWRWAVCPECAQFVDREQWPELHERLVYVMEKELHLEKFLGGAHSSTLVSAAIWDSLSTFHAYAVREPLGGYTQ